MGWNTVVVIYNDTIDLIEKYPEKYSKKIHDAVRNCYFNKKELDTKFGLGQAISTEHANWSQVVIVGRNSGYNIKNKDCPKDTMAIIQMKEYLEKHGYKVTEKRVPKNKSE